MRREALRPCGAALAAASLVILGACSGGTTQPTATPTTSLSGTSSTTTSAGQTISTTAASPSKSTSTSVSDPNVPAAARANTPAGAEAFTTYFFQQVNASYSTAQAKLMDTLILSSCKTCAGFQETVTSLSKDRHHYSGDFATPSTVTTATFNPPDAKTFVSTSTPQHRIVDSVGRTIETIAPRNFNVSVFLNYSNGWRVSEIKEAA